ncbi:MAG TPA: hypothetical protein VLA24_17935 [Pseudomonadales bacterium]|nr:hypothetical protein [Pseudomonadales bacterium]
MINLTLQRNTIADDIDMLVRRVSNPGNAQKRSIGDAIRQQFQENFTRQSSGSGNWAPLARSTVLDRIRRGYAGNRPILVRSGRLRGSYVESGGADHHSTVRQLGGYTIFEEGSNSSIGLFHERGTSRMPQRSISVLDDGQEASIANVIDFMLLQIEQNIR